MNRSIARWALIWAGALALAACGGGYGGSQPPAPTASAPAFVVVELVSNDGASREPGGRIEADAQLVDSWGVAVEADGRVWVSNRSGSAATSYQRDGDLPPLAIELPAPAPEAHRPTGIAANDTDAFSVPDGRARVRCAFIVAVGDGALACGAPGLSTARKSVTVVDNGPGKDYTGLAIVTHGNEALLYAADFRGGSVDVFDGGFNRIDVAGRFADPLLPEGYAPFSVQRIGGLVYVAYARRSAGDAALAGAGLGLVNVFDVAGNLIRRLIPAGDTLNAPWGIARAPAGFGRFAGSLLVANAGDGTIRAFDAAGQALGVLTRPDGSVIVIDGLRGIAFDPRPADTDVAVRPFLYYAAGPERGRRGVLGHIVAQ